MSHADHRLEQLLYRDRQVVLALLAGVILASWSYLVTGAGMGMSILETSWLGRPEASMAGMAMTPTPWSPGYAVVVFLMWWIMMIAMMLPSAAPMILLFATINRRQRKDGTPYVPTTLFMTSYLLAWAGFSLAATVLHWAAHQLGLLAQGMVVSHRLPGAGILIAAGLYQLTPLKRACLRHCRMPVQYLSTHWRPGNRGAFMLGLRHGTYCLGCCWVLMLLLFFGGVMNLYWIAGLALYVLLEKALRTGHWLDYGLGMILTGAGAWLLVS